VLRHIAIEGHQLQKKKVWTHQPTQIEKETQGLITYLNSFIFNYLAYILVAQ
jgi:hypothetical protein